VELQHFSPSLLDSSVHSLCVYFTFLPINSNFYHYELLHYLEVNLSLLAITLFGSKLNIKAGWDKIVLT